MEAMDAVVDGGDNAASEFLGCVLAENNLFRTIEEILSQPCSLDELTIYLQNGIHPKTGKPFHESFDGAATKQLLYQKRDQTQIYSPKSLRDSNGKLTTEIRRPQNPDEVSQEYVAIQGSILAEIAKPGSRRISLEGLGLLSVKYFQESRPL
jgi:hypothetical protein